MKAKKEGFDVYQMVTDIIIKRIEEGTPPWRMASMKVSFDEGVHYNRPVNFATRKPYEGVNTITLGCSPYEVPLFVTFKQAQSLGGTVRKGAKSLPVIYWQKSKYETTSNDGELKEKERFLLRYYNVFNVEDTDLDYSPYVVEKTNPESDSKKIESCENIIQGYADRPKRVFRDRTRMFYRKSEDIINMPPLSQFEDPRKFYCIYFHEMVHSTGHPRRLNREGVGNSFFGSASYSKEELTAELGASYLAGIAGISTPDLTTNSAAYIKHWLEVLRNDKKFIFESSRLATKAVKYILGEAPEEVQ